MAALLKFKTESQVLKDTALWAKAANRLSSSQMPPQGSPQPSKAQRTKIVAYLESLVSKANCAIPEPGKVTLRRLNRAEYNNTVRDLVGVDFKPGDDFPTDDVGNGFDNIGDVLSISPLLMEKYLDAAEKIAQKAVVIPENRATRYDAGSLDLDGGVSEREGQLGFFSRGTGSISHKFARRGAYRVKVVAWAQQAGPEAAKMALELDGKVMTTFEVRATQDKPAVYEADIEPSAGTRTVSVSFVNDYYMPQDPNPRNRDRNLFVSSLEIVAPSAGVQLPASHRRIVFVQPEKGKEREAASKILGQFARRAYRRPVSQDEVGSLLRIFDLAGREKEPFERGIQLGMQAALTSPHFLFRVESSGMLKSPVTLEGQKSKVRNLSSHEIASRLSYFLWSSMPDEELMALADKNALQSSATLLAQVRRMLKDPKAKALAENFASQWLHLRKLDTISPDPKFGFDEVLRAAMRQETLLFFQNVVDTDASILDFIDGKYSFVNGPLARLYGIPGVSGSGFRKVALTGQRAGVLTQGSILTLTSNPTRTSPVKRGKWILENILNDPPAPPPPGADNLGSDPKKLEGKTLRTIMAEHRINPSCANCHSRMDVLGLGLENFDAVGRWRAEYSDGLKIDSTGKLPDGRAFSTPRQLIGILRSDKKRFVRALGDRMLTYALGRGLNDKDNCAIDDIEKAVVKGKYRFSSLVNAIVLSDSFRRQRG